MINASDKMLLWYTVQLPALGDSGQILDAVRKSVGNITPDNADKMDIAWMPGLEETWFYVGATYNYNGSNSIEDIQNAYNDFVYDWVKNQINPKIQKTFADFGN